jgi:hypothetical protein
LTKSPMATMFWSFRGHLSRPACSHVKQLAKQAGDNSDPGRTYVQAGFFMAWVFEAATPSGRVRDDEFAIDTQSVDPQRGSRP